jgi:hypothetical protein
MQELAGELIVQRRRVSALERENASLRAALGSIRQRSGRP